MVGRTANEPELRYSTNGTAVTTFRLAVDRPFKNDKGEREPVKLGDREGVSF